MASVATASVAPTASSVATASASAKVQRPFRDPLEAWPPPNRTPFRQDVVETPLVDGAVLKARVLVHTLTAEDTIDLHFEIEKDLAKLDPEKAKMLSTYQVLSRLEVEITAPDGKTQKLVANGRRTRPKAELRSIQATTVSLSERGIQGRHWRRGMIYWSKEATPLLQQPGTYVLRLRGQLDRQWVPLTFELDDLQVVVADVAEVKPLRDIERIAGEIVKERRSLDEVPTLGLPILEDQDGNLVTRFHVRAHRYRGELIEVIVDRQGNEQFFGGEEFVGCIAEGVAISTPEGPVPVEELQVGDTVWSYDVETSTRTQSQVELIASMYSNDLVRLTPALTVSSAHPVFVGGAFIEADTIATGAGLLSLDGRALFAQPSSLEGGGTVYDLTVSHPHTYFAGNVLVHNKAGTPKLSAFLHESVEIRPADPPQSPAP